MRRIFWVIVFVIPYFSCTTNYQKLKYPDDFPHDIIDSTQNIDKIVADYLKIKNDSLEAKSKKGLCGKRSKESVMKGVMQNLAKLRYLYNIRLRMKPGLYGKITVRFTILGNGIVNSAVVTHSTIKDKILESALAGSITNWRFEKLAIDKDITQVTYPFVFYQDQTEQDIWNLDIEESKKGDRSTTEIVETIEHMKNHLLPFFIKTPYKEINNRCGSLTVKLNIRQDGFIEKLVLINASFESTEIITEMLKEIREWVFPKCNTCNGNTSVEYTLRFTK